MKTQITAVLILDKTPVEIKIDIEFEKGEYVEVIKELPAIIKQLIKIEKGEK